MQKKYTFDKLTIDPVTNPAVLDTLTWDSEQALNQISSAKLSCKKTGSIDGDGEVKLPKTAQSVFEGRSFATADLPDGQSVILAEGDNQHVFSDSKFGDVKLDGEKKLELYPLSDSNLSTYVSKINPRKGPKALGSVPRLGIGVRQSTMLWPGIFSAMTRGDFSANAIQNSVRELNRLSILKEGLPPRTNHLFSFGEVPEGHAGSTFEGLWTYGVYEALRSEFFPRYGADADHLQVKRGAEGIERTKKFIDSSRYYSFYTLDVSDIINYQALWMLDSADSRLLFEELIPEKNLQKDILFYHRQRKIIGKHVYQFDDAQICRYIGKYWAALDHVQELEAYVKDMKNGEPVDLELSIDENPPEVKTNDTITSNEELLFLMEEIKRRKMGITHIAPNFGVEKCTDYRSYDGLDMLSQRVKTQVNMANEYGFMLDCHSGDDLSKNTRKALGKASKGRLHFKISPSLQQLYSRVLSEVDPEKFEFWWNETLRYTKECAGNGSSFAVNALKRYDIYEDKKPSPDHFFFQEYNFAIMGMREPDGQFKYRDMFYDVSDYFKTEMTQRLDVFLCNIADDIFNSH